MIFLSSGCPRQKKNRQDEARFGLWGSKHLYLEYGRKVPNTGTRSIFSILWCAMGPTFTWDILQKTNPMLPIPWNLKRNRIYPRSGLKQFDVTLREAPYYFLWHVPRESRVHTTSENTVSPDGGKSAWIKYQSQEERSKTKVMYLNLIRYKFLRVFSALSSLRLFFFEFDFLAFKLDLFRPTGL